MNIIQEPQWIEEVSYQRVFRCRDNPNSGFSFPCDEQGNVSLKFSEAKANYEKCIDGTYDVIDKGIQKHEHNYKLPAIGLCDCGTEVALDGFTNTCEKCGTDYNWAGQRLAPRSQWGEDTGESLSDILRIK